MHIKETYAVFKDKHPNVKIGISKFAWSFQEVYQ